MKGMLKELTIISLPEITSHVGDVQSPHTNLLKSKEISNLFISKRKSKHRNVLFEKYETV